MLSNLKGIKLQGRKFSSNLVEFNFWNAPKTRFSLLYGKNGSGKTTISDAFSCLKDNNKDDFSDIITSVFDKSKGFSETDKNSIHVFNEKFIDSNIKIEENGINSIVMFGKQVDIDNKIKEKESKQKEKLSEIEKQTQLLELYEDKTNEKSPDYYLNLCILELKKDSGWAGKERLIKSGRVNSSVNQTTVSTIMTQHNTEKELSEISKEFSDKKRLFDSVTNESSEIIQKVETLNFDNIDSKAKSILLQKIEQTELTEREKRIFDFIGDNGQDLLAKAKIYFSKSDADFCPYCYQAISTDYKVVLMQEFQKVLNKEVEEYQKQLDALKIKEISFSLVPYSQLDKNLIQTVQLEINKFNKTIEKYNDLIDKRKNNVYQNFSESDYVISIEDAIIPVNSSLVELEKKRNEFNQLIKNKKDLQKELLQLNSQIANKQISENYKKYKKQVEERDKEIQILKNLEQEKNSIELELSSLNEQKKSIKIAQKHINYLLQYVFFSKDKLTIETQDGIYQIKSCGMPVKPNQISCGERNILALCYYFTELFSGKEESKIYSDSNLLIIDDPVSSFDKENRVGVLSLLKYELQHFVSGNSETKILIMTHDLMAFYDIEKIASELKSCNYYICELMQEGIVDFKFNKSNEYTKLLTLIYSFANDPSNNTINEISIGNIMRRVVEAYSSFIYKVGINSISFDEEIFDSIQNEKQKEYFSNLMYRIVLNGESHSEERIKSLEDFCNGISADEKVRIAKDILCFLYLLNPVHIKKHLKDIPNSQKTIEEWCRVLPV